MGQYDQLPKLAGELTALHPTILAAPGGAPSARAAKAATNSIPIAFVSNDSVREGLVESLSRPGGKITGVDIMSGELTGKRLELLAQLVPAGKAVGFLTNPKGALSVAQSKEAERAARVLGREVVFVSAGTDTEIDAGFEILARNPVGGLVVENDPYFDSRRERLIELTAKRALPAIYHIREFPAAGGLMSYGANLVDAYYQMGVQVGRVLKGANITDLPIVRPTKFELALNLKTAKALGLTIPPTVLAIVDEVID
jgi:putative ABC transport system substrate-binding protein